MTMDEALRIARERQLAGDLAGARRLYDRVLTENPNEPAVLFRVGLLEMQASRLPEAAEWIGRAIAQAPAEFTYHFALGQTLAGLERYEEAAESYRHALKIKPDAADVQFALGLALHSKGNLNGAIEAYREGLELKPGFAGAMTNLGAALRAIGQNEQAIDVLREAVRIEPLVAIHHINLGAALCQSRRFAEAQAVLQRACELDPRQPHAAYNLGVALGGMGQLREAAAAYRRAIELQPDHADAYNNLGTVCQDLGEFQAAAVAFDAAIRVKPNSIVGYNNAGCLLRTLGRMEQAEDVLRAGLTHGGPAAPLLNNLGSVLKDAGALDEAIECYRKSLAIDPTDAGTHSNLVYALSFQAIEGKTILKECRRWDAAHALPLRPAALPLTDRSADRRLRIGYVSGDFREHCQSLFTVPLLSNHDHSQFEIVCYSSVVRPDELTKRIAGYADVWRDVHTLDDESLAQLIREDHIDLLVDLGMHMATGRPLVFARCPASVQVCWLAYPGTTGINTIGYRLTDPQLDPDGFDDQYTERSIRLPHTFWCYDPLSQETEGPLPAATNGFVTFGCLNNPCKLTDRTLAMWAKVLEAIPTARLLLMAPPGRPRQRLSARFSTHGVDVRRVAFESFRPRPEYLRTYHRMDLGLDTFPYNGHTTSLDSFWMGVPVVTRVGQTAVGRGGLSQLHNLGLCELAAESDEQFVEIAVDLATDLARLADMRRMLRRRMEQSPLMDGRAFARDMETAYRRIWLQDAG